MEYKKIQSIVGEHSFTIIMPKDFATQLGITKEDFVNAFCKDDHIIIEKNES